LLKILADDDIEISLLLKVLLLLSSGIFESSLTNWNLLLGISGDSANVGSNFHARKNAQILSVLEDKQTKILN
jgi:hypothetical protein